MDLPAKIDFFAAIWRVMRDDNMSIQEVSRFACRNHVAAAARITSAIYTVSFVFRDGDSARKVRYTAVKTRCNMIRSYPV